MCALFSTLVLWLFEFACYVNKLQSNSARSKEYFKRRDWKPLTRRVFSDFGSGSFSRRACLPLQSASESNANSFLRKMKWIQLNSMLFDEINHVQKYRRTMRNWWAMDKHMSIVNRTVWEANVNNISQSCAESIFARPPTKLDLITSATKCAVGV